MIGCRKLEIHCWSGTTGESSLIVLPFGGKQALPLRRSSEDGDLCLGEEEPKEVGIDNGKVCLPDFSLLFLASEMARLMQKDPVHCSEEDASAQELIPTSSNRSSQKSRLFIIRCRNQENRLLTRKLCISVYNQKDWPVRGSSR